MHELLIRETAERDTRRQLIDRLGEQGIGRLVLALLVQGPGLCGEQAHLTVRGEVVLADDVTRVVPDPELDVGLRRRTSS